MISAFLRALLLVFIAQYKVGCFKPVVDRAVFFSSSFRGCHLVRMSSSLVGSVTLRHGRDQRDTNTLAGSMLEPSTYTV